MVLHISIRLHFRFPLWIWVSVFWGLGSWGYLIIQKFIIDVNSGNCSPLADVVQDTFTNLFEMISEVRYQYSVSIRHYYCDVI